MDIYKTTAKNNKILLKANIDTIMIQIDGKDYYISEEDGQLTITAQGDNRLSITPESKNIININLVKNNES